MRTLKSLAACLQCAVWTAVGCVWWVAPSTAWADDSETPSAQLRDGELLPSPLEAEAGDFADRERLAEAEFAERDAARQVRLLIVSAGATWLDRASEQPSLASYLSGPGVEFAGTILVTDWLGVRLSGAYDTHIARLRSLGNETSLLAPETTTLEGLTLAASVEPRWQASERISILAGFGVAWDRFSLGAMSLETSQGTAEVRQRTGVLLEFPITLGVTFSPIPQRFGIGIRARYAPRTRQTGDLFDGGTGGGQVVSQSSGEMLFVPGLPRFAPALSIGLHCELSL